MVDRVPSTGLCWRMAGKARQEGMVGRGRIGRAEHRPAGQEKKSWMGHSWPQACCHDLQVAWPYSQAVRSAGHTLCNSRTSVPLANRRHIACPCSVHCVPGTLRTLPRQGTVQDAATPAEEGQLPSGSVTSQMALVTLLVTAKSPAKSASYLSCPIQVTKMGRKEIR
jgi:hypothetical protein